MIKSLCLIILLAGLAHQQTITPYYILPAQTTQNVTTSYSFLFQTDTEIASYAQVALTFPFQFNPNALTQVTRVRYSTDGLNLLNATWSANLYTFTIQIKKIAIGNLTIVIDNVLNPSDYTTSSYFTIQTLFQNVVVTSNTEFGRTPFTPAPVSTSGATFTNQLNTYIEQGSSWAFTFTPSTTYSANSTLRFVFPEGFVSNKIQCNVSGVVDPNMKTRVFPSQNIYDCLNLQQTLSGSIKVILSGLVNPNYQMTVSGVKIHILQPNNLIVQEIISSASTVNIQNKPLNTTLTIPNNYRNCSANYIFQINFDTDLNAGDYVQFSLTGNWTLFTNRINVVSGIVNSEVNTARWIASLNSAATSTQLLLSNFSLVPKSTQFTFYLPLMTPLNPNTYTLNINAYRRNGGLAQSYSRTILINQTTGYIREMKLHPMQSPIKLPVGQTGPIEIVLFLRNNLPQTNVLTWGQIIIQITPNIPAPIVGLNGVPKCYFYDNKPAANCTFDSSNPTKTVVTIFTPIDFNFQQSQVPLTITTEGFQQPQNQGITIDTLVKRYFFEIQFYSNLRPYPIPQQVIFDQWIPDSIPITSVSCSSRVSNVYQNDHLKCTLTTPNQVLNNAGHIHFFRVEFSGNGWSSPTAGSKITPNYPCLMYGVNVSATPYVKCDYVTWTTGPYRSQQTSTSYNYITFYGLSTIPGSSTITFQIPNMPRNDNSGWSGDLRFAILEDTPGYNSPIVYLYTQTLSPNTNSGGGTIPYNPQSPSIILSNGVINKVTNIQLNSYSFGVSNPDTIILQVDQTGFPNIGRGSEITCGSHTCSKFDSPVQYFVLYPSSSLGTSNTIIFPNIATPPYSGNFQFKTRISLGSYTYKKGSFNVVISPDTIVTKSYNFAPIQTVTTLYPNSNHFYVVTWTTVNPLLSLSGNSYIKVVFNNVFTLGSTYCQLITSATAYDGRNIFCDLATGGNQVFIKNLADVPAGSTFNLTVQLTSTAIAATVSPTVSIYTYYGNGNLVDQAVNVPFATPTLSNTNLTVFNTFTVASASTSVRAITAGYFGHLLINFQPQSSQTVLNGSRIVITMATDFYPAGNTTGRPLSCQLNGVFFSCDYTLSPFTITLYKTNSSFTTGINTINITTIYQNANGIYFPTSQGRYLNTLEILNQTSPITSLQKVQQAIDILPPQVGYFNVTWANRDQGVYNIFTVQFKNGLSIIPSYNDGTNAGRIYFGFPTYNKNNVAVFAADLGTGLAEGAVLPCFFQNAVGFVVPTSGKTLQCKLRKSLTNKYNAWIEIINFAQIPAGGVMRVFIAKITNPLQQLVDIDFIIKVNTLAVSTNVQSQLYYTTYNMWIDMLASNIVNRNQVNSNSPFFQAGASVGDTNQYFNITPYTGYSQFGTNDWWIIDLDPQFPLSGNIYNCQKPYYQYCIIYPTINWLAVKIGNTTIIPLQPVVSKLPISISRVDTTFKCYTFMNSRWAQTITYTMTAASRWLALRGSITNFNFQVVGSQNKLNVGQKNVQVLIRFNVQHMVPVGGTIEIQFPNNATTVPAIKMHCRSAVTMGSALNGYNTGKPAINVQGEVGCTVQNSYSWIITGFDLLPAGSQVIIYGMIDFPTVPVNTLGMGYICTYSNQDATNTFTTAKTIDYINTNFAILVQNNTWSVDSSLAMLQTAPLRTGYVGDIKFILNLNSIFYCSQFVNGNCGKIYISLYKKSITGASGGFGAPPATRVCTIVNLVTQYKYGCQLVYYDNDPEYYEYYITTYENLPANTNLQVVMTSLIGSGTQGFSFPTAAGIYKTGIEIDYCNNSSCNNDKVQAQYIEVYGPNWLTLFFNSTVSIPSQNNFILVTLVPSTTISTTQQIVIQIPTVAIDNSNLFPADLGMGYDTNDNLIFDLYESSITSMTCNVFPGDSSNNQPTKIVCSSFSAALTTSSTIKFGFWVVNPPSTIGMSIPVQVYAYDQPSSTKFIWSIVQAGIRVLPITVTPINDTGNFASSNAVREYMNTHLSFTTRNTRTMVLNDWYILKFNFDLRQSANSNGSFNYNSGLGSSGDVIFMRNCRTIMLRVGTNNLAITTPGSTTLNARITSLIYNPPYQLTAAQATIYGYMIYNSMDYCERVYYRDRFPTLVPQQPSGQTFTITPIYTTNQKGMLDDWKISFKMSSAGTNSTSLVKYISIQFPSSSVSDVQLMSRSCIQYITSDIQVSRCVIDINNRVIWVTPVVKSTYTDASVLIIQTAGLAIKNAINTQINLNMFTIRYYTWPDGMSNPGITAGSDNWCFMKQDSSNIDSSTIQYTKYSSSSYSQHSYIDSPPQLYVNEWQPADYFIGNGSHAASLSKSPFSFKFIAPAAYNSLQGSSNYHNFAVNFGSVYTYPTLNQNNLDLFYYVPVCYLNGFQILQCSISSTTITMRFQQAIANGQTVSVTFSILNPKDESDYGFILANTNNPTVTFAVTSYNYNNGINYLVNPEPFHTFYRATSPGATYPSYGIQTISITYGTQVVGQLNYIQFTLTLTRTDINGFVIEIPVVNQDGTKIYDDPTLLGLQSGSAYPCSMGIYTPVSCYYQKGNSNGFGSPTRIYVSGFTLSGTSVSFRMLFTNPDNTEVFPSFIWKAFGGSFSTPSLMGSQFRGIHNIFDAFKVFPTTSYYSSGSLTCYPSKALWQENTYYDCYHSTSMSTNDYAVIAWPLVDQIYGTIGDYAYTNNYDIYDIFYVYTDVNEYYVYLVKKLSANYVGTSSTYMRFGNLKMKHHIVTNYKLYLLGKPWTTVYTCGFDASWINTNLANSPFGAWSLRSMDTQVRISGWGGWQFLSINAGNSMSGYSNDQFDPSEKVVEIRFSTPNSNARPYSSLTSTASQCSLESGLVGNDPLNPITCSVDAANNRILFYNVFWFTNTNLNFYYYATTNSDSYNHDILVRVWANVQAFNDGNYMIFYSQTNSQWTYDGIPLNRNTGYSQNIGDYGGNGDTSRQKSFTGWALTGTSPGSKRIFTDSTTDNVRTEGYAKVMTLTTTSITVRLLGGSNGASFSQAYRMGFRFHTPRLTTGGTCSSISVWHSRLGWNFTGQLTCGAIDRRFFAIFRMWYTTTSDLNQWPTYSSGDYLDFYFTFNSVGGDVSTFPNSLWVSASQLWQNSKWYQSNYNKCGCYNCWQTCYDPDWPHYGYYSCNYGCHCHYSCRYLLGWDYYTFTGTQQAQYNAPTANVANAVSIAVVSNQYSVQTQFSFYLNTLQSSISSTMTSYTSTSNNQLIIQFDGNGNNNYGGSFFLYTNSAESAAYIECLCAVSTSPFNIDFSTSYSQANCTRYVISGYNPFISVRVAASSGNSLRCFFPGYRTPTYTGSNTQISASFYINPTHHFKSQSLPYQHFSYYQTRQVTYPLTTTGASYGNFYQLSQNGQFWTTSGQVDQTKSYYLYAQPHQSQNNPIIYYSAYYPKPSQTACNNNNFLQCRTYSSFTNRRYFMVARFSGSTSSMTFNYNAIFPDSKDVASSFYSYYIGWTAGGYNYYRTIYSTTSNSGYLSSASPAYGVTVPIYGSYLNSYSSPFVLKIDLNGKTLYSNQRTVGPFKGSFIQVVANGFSSLFGCGAYLYYNNKPAFFNNALYCVVQNSNTLKIWSNSDIAFTGQLIITMSTSSVPTSTTFTFSLYDKYLSGSDYGISVSTSTTLSNNPSSVNILPPTNIFWRRQAYKQLRTDAAPMRMTVNNNFQYVSAYSMSSTAQDTTLSNGIVFSLPTSVSAGTKYKCLVRQYLPTKYDLYNEYTIACLNFNTTHVLVQSIPSHILSPTYYYDFIIYINGGSSSPFITSNSNSNYNIQVLSCKSYTCSTRMYYDVIPYNNYQNIYPITLNGIYFLTRQAAIVNSLYIDFTIKVATPSAYYIQFVFDNLDLNYFGISNGGTIPCYINGLSAYSGKSNGVTCFGFSDGVNSTSPLTIRVVNFASFSANKNVKIAFDNFNNPPLQTLFAVPINLVINFKDEVNQMVYRSYFPNIYYSDSINIYSTGMGTGSLSVSNANVGASTSMSWSLGWPYNSGSNVWDKLVMKINGGMTCCRSFSSLAAITDNYQSYNALWINTAANTSVYVLANRGQGVSTTFYINNVINPFPVSYDTYQQGLSATFLWYSVYKTYTRYTLTQPSYSAYNIANDFRVSTSASIISTSKAIHFNSHQYYPLTYQFSWTISSNSYPGRNMSYVVLQFTGGVRSIQAAWFYISAGVINPTGCPEIGRNSSNSRWYINITGIQASSFSSTWYLRVRLYANNNNLISYTSTLYNYNGQQQFAQTSGSFTPSSSGGFSTSGLYGTPNAWTFQHQRYTQGYYQLQRTYLNAKAGLTTNKLFFKFTSPYNISQVETFSFISSSSLYPAPNTPNNGLHCIIQKTYQTYVSYGTGLYAPCTYSSGTFIVNAPVGGLSSGNEYLLTIIDKRQLTSTFNMPITPQRIQISLIYNNILSIAYGDVYTLDFAGYMTSYSVDHSHLMSGYYDMLGFTFQPSFALLAASTSSPITESVLSFQVESKYYDDCLSISSVFSNDSPYYNGIQYSHYASFPVANANTRTMCGKDTQLQNWAPAKLTITDYGALSTSTSYYFRFPLITLPSGTNVPLTYKTKLLYYANGVPYPTIISYFNYQAKDKCTGATSNINQDARLILSNNVVQSTTTITFDYNTYNFGNGAQTLVKFRNNNYPGLTSISTLTTLSQSNYNYQYYPNINLCSFKFTGGSGSSISLGSYPTSIDQQNFEILFVHTYSGTSRRKGWFPPGQNNAVYTINKATTSWTTSSITKGTNILTTNSWDLYTVRWSANYLTFPQGSYMIVTFQPQLTLIDQYCYSYSGFLQGVNTNSNLVCKRYSSNQVIISGYAALASSAQLVISVYMSISDSLSINSTTGSTNNFNTYATINVYYTSLSNPIITANTASYLLSLSNIRGSNLLSLSGTMTNPYTAGQSFPLYITFQLKTNTLTAGDYLQIDFGNWVLDSATTGQTIFKYQISGNNFWVPINGTKLTGNMFKLPVYSAAYTMPSGPPITLWVDTFAPTLYYGANIPSIQWNNFKIYAYKSGGTLVEQEVYRIWTEPYGHASFSVTPVLTYVGATTLYQFSVTPNISATAGDTILIQFTTSDGLTTSNLFSNNLGASISAPYPGQFDCNQAYGARVISDSVIKCRVYQGNNAANPPIPTTIAIPIKKAISANTLIKFNIFNIVNPNIASYPIGVVFKLANPCSTADSNNLCAYYKSVTYLSYTSAPGGLGYGPAGTLTFNPTNISATNTIHTVAANFPMNVGDWLKLTYYTQIPIPTVCTITSSNGECYSYPTTNIIMIKATVAQSGSYTFSLGGMTNPYQNTYGNNTFNTEIWRSGYITNRFYTNYAASILTYDSVSSAPLVINFVPTLTPNYQLKYGFNNIARIQLTNLLQNKYVQMIYLTAPGQINIDTSYCNATMQTYPGQAVPYPYRLVCETMSSNAIKINLQSDFPAWTSSFTGRSLYVYLRYTIADTQVSYSNYWTSQAFADPSSTNSNYLIAQGTGRFSIVEYQLPHLYVISLFTRSFGQRTCTINQQCMFYGFLLPSTPQATMTISSMTFLLPKEFNYSTAQTFDRCTLQPTTTLLYTFGCSVTRNNSQITIGYTPGGSNYNQGYNLINLDHSVSSMLFTSPKYPGDHYQMQVNLWSNTNALVQTQYVNITTVYGYYLSVPLITFTIPRDGGAKGLFDLTFTVGSADILPSYTNSASNSITSAIEITFANTFQADLGTGLPAGAQIACINITGLTFNTMGRIKCQLYPSVSTITYPTIVITGYDRIYANTVVRIQFANLKTLPTGITDYCTLGVSLSYYSYGGAKGYIYQPVSFVVGPPTAPVAPKSISFNVSQLGTNTVGQLTNYSFTGTLGSGFSPITSSDYFVIQFPQYTFQGRFNLNAQALCSLAAGSKCSVFGLASQVYIQPSATISASSFSFTLNNILNAAFSIQYLNRTITLFTLVNNKVNALGTSVLLKFTQASSNISAIINSIDSIYGGDAGINYYFQFQLNSYLPESGKISVFFPTVYTSLFTVNSRCYLSSEYQILVGKQAYCSIINSHQLVIVPGVLLSRTQAYEFVVTNITNPNFRLTSFRFTIATYYSEDVYRPLIISQRQFSAPIISPITVKTCNFALQLSMNNPNIPASYKMTITCPTTIKSASQLKVYLSWNPSLSNGTCIDEASVLYSKQCNIMYEYSGTSKLTFLNIWLRSISAQKPIVITGRITNGNQGTYTLNATISYNGFVYMNATSQSFYIGGTSAATAVSSSSGSIITSTGQAISIRSANYPYNRLFRAIYTFALTSPQFVVSTLHIEVPSLITQSSSGISCNYNNYKADDDYFNLMLLQDKNQLSCEMKGQKIIITGLTPVLSNLSSNGFLYLAINGLLNPQTSIRQSNFTFTFINTSSTYVQAVLLFTLPLSYPISDAPKDMQIGKITLSDNKYYIVSQYTLTIGTVNGITLTIPSKSSIGVMIRFPKEYEYIWTQIAVPSSLNLTISSTTYTASNITMSSRYLYAVFPNNTFSSQINFTTFNISFIFRNPNISLDCTVLPVFTVTLFDFKAKSIYAQTLSNNKVCPNFSTYLYSINVTGNTKISAGSSSQFIISLQKPAQNLTITPACTSSAISFSPSSIVFSNYSQYNQTFNISAANGLSGSFNITFIKSQASSYTFYNDIQFLTLNIYVPTSQYSIKVIPFRVKSIGLPIEVTIQLQVGSPTSFALITSNNCSSQFDINPSVIQIPAQTTLVKYNLTYKGNTIPPACSQTFKISSITTNNYYLQNQIVYYSASLSIDRTAVQSPMVLQLTTVPQNSTDVGHTIVSTSSSSNSSQKYTPYVYALNSTQIGSNSASFTAITSYSGTVYYTVVAAGTPTSLVTTDQIYSKKISSAISYGQSTATLQSRGVNILAQLEVKGLKTQQNYTIAVYLNSTIGISSVFFKNFTTAKASNGAAIKIAMSSPINVTAYVNALSQVLSIIPSRIYILTPTQILATQQSTHQPTVMNNRYYIYETIIAPNPENDYMAPKNLLQSFNSDSNAKAMLLQFIPQFIPSYLSTIRQIFNTVPKIRTTIQIIALKYNSVTFSVSFWEQQFVYAVIIKADDHQLLSSQVINGLNANNTKVISQHYANVTSNTDGSVVISFNLLDDSSNYYIFVSAQCPLPYVPRLALSDSNVMVKSIKTPINPNLMKNKNAAVDAIADIDPEMGRKARQQTIRTSALEKIHNIDKSKKKRQHD